MVGAVAGLATGAERQFRGTPALEGYEPRIPVSAPRDG